MTKEEYIRKQVQLREKYQRTPFGNKGGCLRSLKLHTASKLMEECSKGKISAEAYRANLLGLTGDFMKAEKRPHLSVVK